MTVDPSAPLMSDHLPDVALALAGVQNLADLPLAEHVARFDALHDALAVALASIDEV